MRGHRKFAPQEAWCIPVGYAVLAGTWILLSDAALHVLVTDPDLAARLQVFKALTFILLTALLLFVFLNREYARQLHLHRTAKERLDESEKRYRSLFHDNQTPIILVDPADSSIVDANQAAGAFYGYPMDGLLAMSVPDIRAEEPEGSRESLRLAATGSALRFPARHLLAGGEVRDVTVFAGPLRLAGSDLLYVMVHDVSERRRAEEAMVRSLREKEALLKEVHHRVKNNLQLIQSLLRLQATLFECRRDRDLLAESLDRIQSIAMVHELLYSAQDMSRVPLHLYIRKLTTYLTLRLAGHGRVRVEPPAGESVLGLDQAVPCGLLVGELLSNSLRHAFPGQDRGAVRVSLATAGERAVLAVEDDGAGLPPELDPDTGGSLGLTLVRSLCEQLGGRPRWSTGRGTRFELEFPLRCPETGRLAPLHLPL